MNNYAYRSKLLEYIGVSEGIFEHLGIIQLSPQDIVNILSALKKNYSVSEIAKHYNIDELDIMLLYNPRLCAYLIQEAKGINTIQAIVKQNGTDKTDKIINLWKDGKSQRDISKITGVPLSTVNRKIIAYVEQSGTP